MLSITIDKSANTLKRNREILLQKEFSHKQTFSADCISAEISGPKAWELLRFIGNDGIQNILDDVQESLDSMPLYAALKVTKEIEGVQLTITFVKEYEECPEALGSYRIAFFAA